MKIVVADDHMIVRRGMQLIVAKRADWEIVADAATDGELFAALREHAVDVVVIDLSLRGRSTIDLLRQLRREHPKVPVLILSSLPEEQYALHSLRAGARGYVAKDATADEILDAIARVAGGRISLSAAVAERLANEVLSRRAKEPHERLSPREFDVLRMLALGRSMTEIAAAMQISIKTASTYRTRILEKTGFATNADLIAYAIRSKLV